MTSLEGRAILDRYQLRRRLGSGGMGVVYEAFDTERRTNVAIKVMRSVEAAALYRFKKEFRVLADLHHPNVVMLHELVATSNRWFLTMELVDGVSFREHVRRASTVEHDAVTHTVQPKSEPDPATLQLGALESPDTPPPAPRPPGVLDEARLRAALRQLCEGVAFLHKSRCLHRDIKPSNVLVTAEGRVVLCDFGLVKELAPELHSKTIEKGFAGTISYMSPEQARGEELTEASDWYSVGVMLYEALTGQLPYVGDREFVLYQKTNAAPTAPALVDPAAPADLSALCLELLASAPGDRPTARAVLDRLGAVRLPLPARSMEAVAAPPFLGRKRELAVLDESFARVRDGTATTVLLHGTSGMGKSSLLLEFLDHVRDGDAIVLAGRCYERESVPYKGFDSVVDALSAHLLKLDEAACRKLVPRDVVALSRLFPVLRRVDAIEEACVLDFEVPDPQESRRRAIAALRELLTRVARSQMLVLCIDDLQWGDADSALLLADILRPPGAPPLLALLSYRSDEAANAPVLQALHAQRTAGALGEVRELQIGALAPDEARALAAAALGGGKHASHATAIAAESGGSPFFVGELARYVLAGAPTERRRLARRGARVPHRSAAGGRACAALGRRGRRASGAAERRRAERRAEGRSARRARRAAPPAHDPRGRPARGRDDRDVSRSNPRVGRALARRDRAAHHPRPPRAHLRARGRHRSGDPRRALARRGPAQPRRRSRGGRRRAGEHRVRVRPSGAPVSPRARAR
jgi:serine/threonine protein kinase